MNDKFRNFHIIRSRAVPQKNIKDLQSKIISELINIIMPTTSAAIVVLIILATSYVGIYLISTIFSNQYLLMKKVNLSKMSETIKLVIHNATLLAGWVLYLNDKFRKASD